VLTVDAMGPMLTMTDVIDRGLSAH
jgi:hypothetical protein